MEISRYDSVKWGKDQVQVASCRTIEKDELSASASGTGPLVHFFLCTYVHSNYKVYRGTPKSPNKETPT